MHFHILLLGGLLSSGAIALPAAEAQPNQVEERAPRLTDPPPPFEVITDFGQLTSFLESQLGIDPSQLTNFNGLGFITNTDDRLPTNTLETGLNSGGSRTTGSFDNVFTHTGVPTGEAGESEKAGNSAAAASALKKSDGMKKAADFVVMVFFGGVVGIIGGLGFIL